MIASLEARSPREGHMAEALALSKSMSSARGQNLAASPRPSPRRRNPSRLVFVEHGPTRRALGPLQGPSVPKTSPRSSLHLATEQPTIAIYEATPVQVPSQSVA